MTRTHWLPLRKARTFVSLHHRHHWRPQGAIIALGAFVDGELRGVIIVGRPNARRTQNRTDMLVAEVLRCCTLADRRTSTGHAECLPSRLYAAARRLCQAMGVDRLETKILAEETGQSLLAAGWMEDGQTPGGSWDKPSRPRETEDMFGRKYPTGAKRRFAVSCVHGARGGR